MTVTQQMSIMPLTYTSTDDYMALVVYICVVQLFSFMSRRSSSSGDNNWDQVLTTMHHAMNTVPRMADYTRCRLLHDKTASIVPWLVCMRHTKIPPEHVSSCYSKETIPGPNAVTTKLRYCAPKADSNSTHIANNKMSVYVPYCAVITPENVPSFNSKETEPDAVNTPGSAKKCMTP